MNELNQHLEALIDQFSKEDTNLCLENRFPYLYTKAYHFIKDGAEAYASSDAFKLPDSSFNSEDLELLKLGCNQILEGRGFSSKNPFTNLGIRGCHKLFELFPFFESFAVFAFVLVLVFPFSVFFISIFVIPFLSQNPMETTGSGSQKGTPNSGFLNRDQRFRI